MARLAAVSLALVAAAAGCGGARPAPVLGGPPLEDCRARGLDVERCASAIVDRLLAVLAFHPYEDPASQAYVRRVGERLVRAIGDRRSWTFQILDDPDPQAHAGLSRTVSVQRGALAYLRSEAELAAVLGHEIGHVLGGHAREVLRDARDDVARSTTSASQRNRADLDDEIQADELAVVLVARAGYDPRAVETTMRALAATQPDVVFEPGDRHPPWRERIARIQAIAARLPPGELGVEAYRAGLATLVAGVDPRVASVVDHAAVFALAGVAVDLPPHRAAQVADHRIEIDLADGSAAELRLLDPAVADFYPTDAPPEDRDVSVAIYRAARHALLITVAGPRATDHVRALRAAIRPVRPAERARTTPVLVDLTAPRALWSP